MLPGSVGGAFRQRDQHVIHIVPFAVLGNFAVKVLFHHGHGAADQIAQIVGQIGVDAVQQRFVAELAVAAEGHLSHEEVADGIAAVAVAQHHGVHHVAQRLGHLLAVQHQPAMAEHLLGQGQSQRVQDDGPDDGMEADDLLAHQMQVGGPELPIQLVMIGGVAQRGDVVGQRVQPHIHSVLGVEVHRNAPLDGGTADAQILQAGLKEIVDHFIFAGRGLDEIGVLLDILDQPVLILAQLEEIGFLAGLFHGAAAIGAVAVLQLQLGEEALAGGAVPALVAALVDVALLVKLAEDLLHGLHVALVRGADEVVVVHIHQFPQVFDARHDLVHVGLRGHALGSCLALDLLAVLVSAGEEVGVIALQLLEAGGGVGGDAAIGVADMQVVAGVVNGRGDVVLLLVFHEAFSPSGRFPCGLFFPGWRMLFSEISGNEKARPVCVFTAKGASGRLAVPP